MPSPVTAEQATASGAQPPGCGANRCSALRHSWSAMRARWRSVSALLIAMRSHISITPRFMPCSSSPAFGSSRRRKKSTIPRTVVSDCPTPTVSTSTFEYPAASHSRIVSRVRRATPPREPPEGDGPNERQRIVRERAHARLIAEDASAREAAGGIHREHRHFFVALVREVYSERLDERAFAHSRRTRDAHAHGASRVRQAGVENILRQFRVVGAAALDDCDSSRQRSALALQDSLNVLLQREPSAAGAKHGFFSVQLSTPFRSSTAA